MSDNIEKKERESEEVEILTCKQCIKNTNDTWITCGKANAKFRVNTKIKEKRKNCYCNGCHNQVLKDKRRGRKSNMTKKKKVKA